MMSESNKDKTCCSLKQSCEVSKGIKKNHMAIHKKQKTGHLMPGRITAEASSRQLGCRCPVTSWSFPMSNVHHLTHITLGMEHKPSSQLTHSKTRCKVDRLTQHRIRRDSVRRGGIGNTSGEGHPRSRAGSNHSVSQPQVRQ